MFMRKKREGFTLVELLIVMAVIAALMGALIPVAINAINHANATRIAENLQSLVTQVQQYAYSEHQIPAIGNLSGSVSGGNLTDYQIYTVTAGKLASAVSITTSPATFYVVYMPKFAPIDVHNVWNGAGVLTNGTTFSTSVTTTTSGTTTTSSSPAAMGVIVKYW